MAEPQVDSWLWLSTIMAAVMANGSGLGHNCVSEKFVALSSLKLMAHLHTYADALDGSFLDLLDQK